MRANKAPPIPAGPLRDSVFSQIDPTFFLNKFKNGMQRVKFPFTCVLSREVIRTPIINRECEDVCYMSGQQLIRQLNNKLTEYTCPRCNKKVHSKNLLYDPGFDHHIGTYDANRNKNMLSDFFVINSNGVQSAHHETETNAIIEKRFEEMRSQLVLTVFGNNKTDAGISINRDAIDTGFKQICQNYNVKQLKEPLSISRGRKNLSGTAFTTLLILHKDEFIQMNMTVNGETYFMPNESEVFLNLQLSAFFIVAAHKSKLFVLRAYLKDIEADTIHFKEIGSIDRRLYYAVACDGASVYIMGGLNQQKMQLYKEAYRVDANTGAVSRLPDMSLERCGVKSCIWNGGNRNTGPFVLNDFNEFYDLRKNAWEKIPTGPLKGYNLAIIQSKKPNELIVYGGSQDPSNDVQLKKYYVFDCNTHQVVFTGEVTEPVKFDFDFENYTVDQTLIRTLRGNRQEIMILKFLPNNKYELKKKDAM